MQYKTTAKTDRPCILCPKTIKKGDTCHVSSGRGSICEECNEKVENWAKEMVKGIDFKALQGIGR